MEYKHTFAGVSSNGNSNWEDEFYTVYDWSTETLVVTKNEYKCYLGSKTINYRLAIQLEDSREFEGIDGPQYILATMYLVPAFRNLHRDRRDELIKFCGCEIDTKTYGKKEDLSYYGDAVSYGDGVSLYQCRYEYSNDKDCEITENKILDDAANTYLGVTGIIGFWLDRPTNMLGMTGWDWLRMHCNGAKMNTILKEKRRVA